MKIVIVLAIIIVFGLVGYAYKNKLRKEYLFLKYLQDFVIYFNSNIVLFKNNSVEIINNYIIMHKNKNAIFNNLFLKNDNLIKINSKILNIYITNKEILNTIENYLNSIGLNCFEFEEEKSERFIKFINDKIKESYENIKIKGDLFLKIMLAVGAVVAILIWWLCMDVSILFKIGAIGILVTVISQLFQHQGRNDLATLTGLAGLVIVLVIVLGMVSDLFSTIRTLFDI